MEEVLRAIAHPSRRAMLELVWDAELPAAEVADSVGLSRPATSQHLRVLREAGLVAVRPEGNRRLYRARPERLEELRAFLHQFWGARLDAMREAAEGARAEREPIA